jgi:hypothetical protein
MLKPGKNDVQYKILITGQELIELKKFTGGMCEAFGLDDRIERYKGTRPIGFYRWDLDCLEMVTKDALEDDEEYPEKSGIEYEAMKSLCKRIKDIFDLAYAEFEARRQR